MKKLAAAALAFALVLAPYTVEVSRASTVNLQSLPVSDMVQGSCPSGAVVKIELSDGRLLVLGDNDRAVLAEESPEKDGYPLVTLGSWDKETGEVILRDETKHKVKDGDSLCGDLHLRAEA
jgi:hypothetical protein